MMDKAQSGKYAGINVGQFCVLNTDEFNEKNGLAYGCELYVAGDAITSVKEEDPYELRRILVCARVDELGHVRATEGAFTIDGLKLFEVPEERQAELESIFVDDFGEKSESKQ